jgi:hypothetical protein
MDRRRCSRFVLLAWQLDLMSNPIPVLDDEECADSQHSANDELRPEKPCQPVCDVHFALFPHGHLFEISKETRG